MYFGAVGIAVVIQKIILGNHVTLRRKRVKSYPI